jgi:asparagine N-glycosylation enzyme membrane subunit Stt3
MAWYKLKFTFVFGLAIAPAAAIVTYLILEGLKKFEIERGIESKILIGAVLLIAVLGVGASARFFPDYVPYVDEHPEWQAAQQWIIQNTPTDAKLFNWWDQGHILTYVTERKVSTDNRNGSDFANKEMAEFVTTTDTNRGYIIASSEVGADYVLLDSSMFASAPTFEYYVKGSTKVDPKIMQKYYSGTIRVLNCTGADNNSSTISCEGNSIPRSQWELFSTKWKATPDDFQNGSDAIFYYRTNDQLLIMNDAMNKTNLVKVWTNSDETSNYYEDTYSKGGIKILKIIK